MKPRNEFPTQRRHKQRMAHLKLKNELKTGLLKNIHGA